MKQKGIYRQWFIWLAWIATIYHFVMPFTPVIDSIYFTPATHHEMMMAGKHHDNMMSMNMSMPESGDIHHHMGVQCPNCILGIHFYVQEQFFVPQPLVALNTLVVAVLLFKDIIFSPWNTISPTSRDPPFYLPV